METRRHIQDLTLLECSTRFSMSMQLKMGLLEVVENLCITLI